jgi:hypothetical protein
MRRKIYPNLLLLIISTQLISCAFFRTKVSEDNFQENYVQDSRRDYWEHWKVLGQDFKNNYQNKLKKPPEYVQKYLTKVLTTIEKRNEVFFEADPKTTISFLIFEDQRPFYFSLPSGEIILSRKLIERYIDHEGALISVIVPEYVRIRKAIYPKVKKIPLGFLELEKMLSMQRLPFDQRLKLHQWSYYLISRSNYNPGQYLSWLQLQNRNHLDFSFYLADSILLVKEEAYLKQFIIQNYGKLELNPLNLKSSKEFYNFIEVYR